ncbi:DUF6042 family protein [Nonomuraea sp. NPDC049709]|uniref:DUF6042 family protein n=1 Tax=Nonomuraea sp. NPDC049709 TaxID=3154736 RepID=UPI00343FD189
MRMIAIEDHWPEYGTIVVRDTSGVDPAFRQVPDLALLGEHDLHAQPGGTIARAGDGWLQASSRDARHDVRLEAHPTPPPLDDGWHDIVESPYHSATGSVMLTTVLHSESYGDRPLDLGPPGFYRVRVCCRRTAPEVPGFEAAAGDLWRMQFWATPAPPCPPRWLARSRPAVRPGNTGWRAVLGIACEEVLHALRVAAADGAVGAERIAAAYQPWSSMSGGWNAPLADDLSPFAAQLGVPSPATRRDLLPLLAAAGLIVAHSTGRETRYRPVAEPPSAETVLRLPDEQVAAIRRQDAFARYTSFAADLAAVAVWSPDQTVSATPAELADRLLATPEEIRDTLRYGAERGLLRTSGETVYTALPRPPEPPQPGRRARRQV